MLLTWHDYSYYPYERNLALREVAAIFGCAAPEATDEGIRMDDSVDAQLARRLTYFSGFRTDGQFTETTQFSLERAASAGRNRQATRYSVHGLHEYKGKFNPQVAKAVLNVFDIGPKARVLDPFCGSGTTLVECAHLGATGVGTDVNPLAIFLANAKLQCLAIPASKLKQISTQLSQQLASKRRTSNHIDNDARATYLRSWFAPHILIEIERVRYIINKTCLETAPIFLALASDLLRDYSHQDPSDLRIRRRSSPLPDVPFVSAFDNRLTRLLARVEAAQDIIGCADTASRAVLADIKNVPRNDLRGQFRAAITSPPYAMALPYIDTQRLSLVWLGLAAPADINRLEASLIGSREFLKSERKQFETELKENGFKLPDAELKICRSLLAAVGPKDGFRRKAVPSLLYRYFGSMRDSFISVRRVVKTGGRYALIVGRNHTVLSGERRDIDTPTYLARLGESVGWTVDEKIELQTYRRYGLHAANGVSGETLLILKS